MTGAATKPGRRCSIFLFGDWPKCELKRHTRNRGVAAAILTGIGCAQTLTRLLDSTATALATITILQAHPLLTEDVDMVTASPYHYEGEVRNVPVWPALPV